ncbi:putative NADPH-dependent methylglyoxal reductase [Diplogelasinospora grovesii]|uniref:NADPH-dependent methylglyoxal reductase n=1 Tax=Diplogelasinospora grovesii TaxID=303347 RepID=A0AAN6N1C1_9PEZI|nr:putative NADPH-dependent methylglyoxal reductase [Diplogelasinospora grovesii]
MQVSSFKGKVLLTGGSGFIASHVLDCLLEHSYEVVVTARSEEKGRRIVDSIDGSLGKKVSFAVVEDIARDGAFDEVVKAHPFDYVVHTASPYQLRFDDPVKDCLDPAIKGTTGILKSVKAFAPTVKRIVITSSSAAVLNPPNHPKVYDETSWADVTWDQAVSDPAQTYRASKKFSEKAAWDFIAAEQPGFDLATINNTYTFGPIPRSLASLGGLNTSNHRIRDMVQGKMKHAIQPTAPVFTFVDVRDVALAHVRAMAFPEAGGHRFYVVGGYFSNTRIADIIRGSHPELRNQLPPADSADDFPSELWQFDTSKSKKLLGLEYTGLEKSVVDTVDSILKFGCVDN